MNIRQRVADLIYPEGAERRDRAEREANTDILTGLGNLRALERALPSAEADPSTLVVLFDANNFGAVNKRAGMLAGDALLRELGQVIERAASRYGFAARCFRKGGDEFVVLCSAQVAAFLRDDVEMDFGSRTVSEVSISISGTTGQTFAEADATLQQRKAAAKR